MPVNAPVTSTTDCDCHADEINLVEQIAPRGLPLEQRRSRLPGQQSDLAQLGEHGVHAFAGRKTEHHGHSIKSADFGQRRICPGQGRSARRPRTPGCGVFNRNSAVCKHQLQHARKSATPDPRVPCISDNYGAIRPTPKPWVNTFGKSGLSSHYPCRNSLNWLGSDSPLPPLKKGKEPEPASRTMPFSDWGVSRLRPGIQKFNRRIAS